MLEGVVLYIYYFGIIETLKCNSKQLQVFKYLHILLIGKSSIHGSSK